MTEQQMQNQISEDQPKPDQSEKKGAFPLTIDGVLNPGVWPIRRPTKPDDPIRWVSVRPVDEYYQGRTLLGVLVGELPRDIVVGLRTDNNFLQIDYHGFNPLIFVYETGKLVLGAESWWGTIDSPEQLREITDADINDAWYVRALRDLAEKEAPQHETPAKAPDQKPATSSKVAGCREVVERQKGGSDASTN